MRFSIATITLILCAAGAVGTAMLFARAAHAPNNDRVLDELVGAPGGWIWAIAPYAALAAVAAAYRKRWGASLFVLCVTLPTIGFALIDTYEYLRPLRAGTNEFARGLGYGTPIVPYLVAVAAAVAIKGADWLRALINPSPYKR